MSATCRVHSHREYATSVYIARKQFIRHQTVERKQARSEDFHTRVVCALLHTCVFMKFKLSCTVIPKHNEKIRKKKMICLGMVVGVSFFSLLVC